jgi:glycosyltransferase involved in cell wall biosynthesis
MKSVITIDCGGLVSRRGISTYIRGLLTGFSEISLKELRIVFLIPISLKQEFSESSNFKIKIIYLPYINQIFWDLFTFPLASIILCADLVHFTGNTGGTALLKLFAKKLVLTLHDVSYLKSDLINPKPKIIRQRLGYYYRRINVPLISSMANQIISVSEFAKDDIVKELGINKLKISVIHNAVAPIFFSNPKVVDKTNTILIVSGNSPQKNLERTISFLSEFLNNYQDWKVVVVGCDGKDDHPRINYMGHINQDALMECYDMSSILLIPSFYESFAIPIVEAMSRGVLVSASASGACKEVGGKFALYYDPYSKVSLFRCLEENIKIVYSCDTSKIKNAQNYAVKFNALEQSRLTNDVYRSVLCV